MTKLFITFICVLVWQTHHHLPMFAKCRKWQRFREPVSYLVVCPNLDELRDPSVAEVSEVIDPNIDVLRLVVEHRILG